MSNSMIINYHDACIYQSDLDILAQSNSWLNDAIIFYEMNSLSTRYKSSNSSPRIRIEFLDPSLVSFFMHSLSPSDEDDHDEIINLGNQWGVLCGVNNSEPTSSNCDSGVVILLVPINDNNCEGFENVSLRNSNAYLGNHWSLLSIIVTEEEFFAYHFDSSSGFNKSAANAVFLRMKNIVQISRGNSKTLKTSLLECDVPQQQNGHDCGIHALAVAECFATHKDVASVPSTMVDHFQIKGSFEIMFHDYMRKYASVCEMGIVKRREIRDKIMLEASSTGG